MVLDYRRRTNEQRAANVASRYTHKNVPASVEDRALSFMRVEYSEASWRRQPQCWVRYHVRHGEARNPEKFIVVTCSVNVSSRMCVTWQVRTAQQAP